MKKKLPRAEKVQICTYLKKDLKEYMALDAGRYGLSFAEYIERLIEKRMMEAPALEKLPEF